MFNLSTQQLDYLGVNGYPTHARELHWDNVAPRIGFTFLLTPETVVRSGYGIVFIDQSGITTPFTAPQFPFIQSVTQKTQDSVNAAFTLSSGPTVAPIPLTPAAGLGQSVYTVNRTAGSGYSQQWNLAVQRAITNNLSFDIAYVGSHIVHVGIPDSNLNQLTAAQLAQGSSLLATTTNPYYGQLPASSSIGGKTVTNAQLLKPYPRFLNVATYRNNSGTTNYNGLEAKVEQRLNHGIYLLFAYTHSKLIDDASSVFSTTVLSSPNSSSLIAADTFRPYLERDSSSGDMPNVTSFSGIYDLPAGHGHSFASTGIARPLGGWALNAIFQMQSGMPVTVTQATNNNAFAGFALQRPNLVGTPTCRPPRATPRTTSIPPPSPPRHSSSSATPRATPSAARPTAISTWPSPSTPASAKSPTWNSAPKSSTSPILPPSPSPTAASARLPSAPSPPPPPTPASSSSPYASAVNFPKSEVARWVRFLDNFTPSDHTDLTAIRLPSAHPIRRRALTYLKQSVPRPPTASRIPASWSASPAASPSPPSPMPPTPTSTHPPLPGNPRVRVPTSRF